MFFFRSSDNDLVPYTFPLSFDIVTKPHDYVGIIYCGDNRVWRGKLVNTNRNDAYTKLARMCDAAQKIVEDTLRKGRPGAIIDFSKLEDIPYDTDDAAH